MNIIQTCVRKLKILRESHDYTQEYVADVLNISQNAYSLLEKGSTKITLDRLELLANLYKIQPEELISTRSLSLDQESGGVKHSNFPPALSSFEKRMYEETIDRLEVNIEKLYGLLHQLAAKTPQEIISSKKKNGLGSGFSGKLSG